MKILKKRGVVEKRGEEETKSMPHAPVCVSTKKIGLVQNIYMYHYHPIKK